MTEPLRTTLLRSLDRIMADAARCSQREEDGFADEEPLFHCMLDARELMRPGQRAMNRKKARKRWDNRKPRETQ